MTRQQYLKSKGWRLIRSGQWLYWEHSALDTVPRTFTHAWKLQMWKEDKPEDWRPE